MVIDIHNVMNAILGALRTFCAWMVSVRIRNGSGAGVSLFALATTILAVTIILEHFIPWGGGDDDD